jgi:WD40 repeat protein
VPQVVRVYGDVRFHTDGDIQSLVFSTDGNLWSIEDPGILRQWNATTGQQLGWTFLSDLETLWVLSGDGRWLASASDDLTLWEVASGKMVEAIPQPSWVTALAFAPQGKVLATGHDDGVVRIWDQATGRLKFDFPGPKRPISAVAFNSDGTCLACAGEDRVICLWDAQAGGLIGTLNGHTDRIQALAWHPKVRRLVSGGWDTTARVWDTESFQPIILLNSHADQVTALAFSPDGSLLACADSAFTIHIWDAAAGKSLRTLRSHEEEIRCLAFSPDGFRLASAGADRVIHLWDARQGRLLSTPQAREPASGSPERRANAGGFTSSEKSLYRTHLTISPDGSRLASTCGGAGLRIWDALTTKSALSPEVEEAPHVLAASPDGRWLAGGGYDNRIWVWDAATGKKHATLEGQKGKVSAVAFAPDSAKLASASDVDGTVWLWNVQTREPALVIPEAADACTVEALAFHPQGRLLAVAGIDWLATGGSDGAIGLWDLQENCAAGILDRGATALAFDPTGRWLASASLNNSVCVWDMESRELAEEFTGPSEAVTCVAYSSDGRWLASGGDDRTVRLWQTESGTVRAVCPLDTQVKALCFSPDGRYLYTGNGNTTSYQLEVQRLLEAGPPTP